MHFQRRGNKAPPSSAGVTEGDGSKPIEKDRKEATTTGLKSQLLQHLLGLFPYQSPSKDDDHKKPLSLSRLRTHLIRSKDCRLIGIVPMSLLLCVLWIKLLRLKNTPPEPETLAPTTAPPKPDYNYVFTMQPQENVGPEIEGFKPESKDDRCWLQEAFHRGEFMVGSHRSLGDSHFEKQPSCLDGLKQLYDNKIYYLDLDLIWDPSVEQLLVAHPNEFKNTTKLYSPCAKLPLETVLQLIEQAMPDAPWFVSLEPKADWGRMPHLNTYLKMPEVLLRELYRVLNKFQMKIEHCTYYLDANNLDKLLMPEEVRYVNKLEKFCSLAFAVRRDEGFDAQLAVQRRQYEWIMPTIEFHPSHPRYATTTGLRSIEKIVKERVPKFVYWVVDTPKDLERVALFHGRGIVSNRPIEMIKVVQDTKEWCPTSNMRKRDSLTK